jgi:hypothetical protein
VKTLRRASEERQRRGTADIETTEERHIGKILRRGTKGQPLRRGT